MNKTKVIIELEWKNKINIARLKANIQKLLVEDLNISSYAISQE